MVKIEGGLFTLGYDTRRESGANKSGDKSPHSITCDFAFDNEKPAHQVFLQDFLIDRAPVSNLEFLEFVNAGGYRGFRWWHSAGWGRVNQKRLQAPLFWGLPRGGGWDWHF